MHLSFNTPLRLDLQQVTHYYPRTSKPVLSDISLQVKERQIHYLLGPSGCGKTTLLRLIAGLEPIQQGQLHIAGVNSGELPPPKRRIGLVFQDHALFPNMTTRSNIAFGLRARNALGLWALIGRKTLDKTAETRINAFLWRFGLDHLADHYPHQLSGGQQQRVGIARALISEPALLLLDEPFSSLDTRTKDQTRDDILHLLHATQTSALIVSHDPKDALHMAEQITILTPEGKVAQSGTPEEIYFSPQSAYVAEFMTEINAIPVEMTGEGAKTQFGVLADQNGCWSSTTLKPGECGTMVIRPEGIKLLPIQDARSQIDTSTVALSPALVQVVAARMLGNNSQIHLRTFTPQGQELHLHVRENGVYLPAIGSLHRPVIDTKMAHLFSS